MLDPRTWEYTLEGLTSPKEKSVRREEERQQTIIKRPTTKAISKDWEEHEQTRRLSGESLLV